MQEAQRMWDWSLGGEDPWRKKWQPTPVFLPGKSQGQRSLVGYSPWGHKELDTAEHACIQIVTIWPKKKKSCFSYSLLSISHLSPTMRYQDECLRLVAGIERVQFSSVQFSRSVMSDSLRPLESQQARPPCPLFPHLFPMKWWDWMPWSLFSECWALGQIFHSPLSLSPRDFLVPLHFLP